MNKQNSGLLTWVNTRFPLSELWNEHMARYYAPKNFNFWYYFGSLALLVLVMQIVTGIWLAMNYTPNSKLAFDSVEYIMRDVPWGWLIRFMHSTGASAFFIIIYLHMFRGLIYGSYKRPRELIWLIGAVIFVLLMAEAFMGYLLPWGQMSYWGAEVITSLFGAIPWVGGGLETWIRGDYNVANATLNRFFAWHVVLIPILLLALVLIHIIALHRVGSNNPDGVEIHDNTDDKGVPLDGVPFHPYYTVKDLVGVGVFLTLFALVVFFAPTLHGWFLEPDNFQMANTLKTPPEIKPLWYFMPFYAMLRSVPNKLTGVITMGASIFLIFLAPWLDSSPVKSHRYRGALYQLALGIFAFTFVFLGYMGQEAPTPAHADLGFRFTELYFSFFILMIIYSKPRSHRSYISILVIAFLLIFALDLLRVGAIPISIRLRTWWIPVLYWLVFISLPIFTRLHLPEKVPARVTSK
ncbi:MAG: cytochrome b N-terminal domain-containing protein [Gammaproteobacteria bacterium]